MLRKANLSIGSGDIFFVRFIRIKTSEEQGLSLFPDEDFTTCPLLAIVLFLVTHSSPTISVLSQLPEQMAISQSILDPATPLIDLLDHPEVVVSSPDIPSTAAKKESSPDTAPGVHSYVNRVLDRVAAKADVSERLTFHSFWRGGAQHTNGAGLCVQWIFDRGAWNMTATNKAFVYVFNTASEDHKDARVLSGRHPDTDVSLLSLDVFDIGTQTKIQTVATALFNASHGLMTTQYNVNERVIETLITYLLLHYPSLKQLKKDGLVVTRLEACVIQQGHSVSDLLAWSSHLTCYTKTSMQPNPIKAQDSTIDITKHPLYLRQALLIEQLIKVNQMLESRVSMIEAEVYNKAHPKPTNERNEDKSEEPPAKCRRTSSSTNLKDVWFSRYTQEPRLWDSFDSLSKHTISTAKLVAAFMKLFLASCLMRSLRSIETMCWSLVMSPKRSYFRFLASTARGAQNVLKSMRKLHKAGHLNKRIQRYRKPQAAGRIVDPVFAHTTNIIGSIVIPRYP